MEKYSRGRNQTLDMETIIILVVGDNCCLGVPAREAGESKI